MSAIVASRPQTTISISASIINLAAYHQMSPVEDNEFPFVHSMAAELMRHDVSTVEVMRDVQRIQPTASLAFREDGVVTGVTGALLLRKSAIHQLRAGEFDGANIDPQLLARPGEPTDLCYGWGIAATTKTAGAAVSAFGVGLMHGPLSGLTVICRAVTPVGRHVCTTRFGYEPLRHADDDLMIRRPTRQAYAA